MKDREKIEGMIADFETQMAKLDALPRDPDTFVIGWTRHGLFFDYDRSKACGLDRASRFCKGEAYRQLKNGNGEYAHPITLPAAIEIARDSLQRSIDMLRDVLAKKDNDK